MRGAGSIDSCGSPIVAAPAGSNVEVSGDLPGALAMVCRALRSAHQVPQFCVSPRCILRDAPRSGGVRALCPDECGNAASELVSPGGTREVVAASQFVAAAVLRPGPTVPPEASSGGRQARNHAG
jgi:hypothetical protein